jgi:uncharacterized protein YaaN involved in tellurite resistance
LLTQLKQLDDETIPAKALAAKSSEAIIEAQELRDLRASRDRLKYRHQDYENTPD